MLDFLQANSDAGGEQMGKWISATVARHTAWLITVCSEFLVIGPDENAKLPGSPAFPGTCCQ